MAYGVIGGKFISRTSMLFSAAAASMMFTVFLGLMHIAAFVFIGRWVSVFYSLASVGYVLSTLYLSFIFFVWVYSLAKTTRLMGVNDRIKPWPAVLWFFIPVANLFKPYLNMRDIWLGMKDGGSAGFGRYLLIKVWWAVFLLSGVFSKLAWQAGLNVTDLESLQTASYFHIASMTLNFVYVIVLILFVTDFRNKFDYVCNNTGGEALP